MAFLIIIHKWVEAIDPNDHDVRPNYHNVRPNYHDVQPNYHHYLRGHEQDIGWEFHIHSNNKSIIHANYFVVVRAIGYKIRPDNHNVRGESSDIVRARKNNAGRARDTDVRTKGRPSGHFSALS